VPDPATLYQIERGKDKEGAQSYPDYRDLRDRNHSFDDLAAYDITQAGLDAGDDDPSRVWVDLVTGNYFDALHVQPYLGRFFHGSDEHGPNSAPYLVLTHEYWHVRFHDDPNVVGRIVRLNKHPFTIVGVAPPDFHGTMLFFGPQVFAPVVHQEQIEGTNSLSARGNHWLFQVVGHLKPGVTVAQAVADLNAIGADDLRPRTPRSVWRLSRAGGSGIPPGIDAARRTHSRGRVRQSRQPLRRARCRSLARGGPPTRPRRKSRPRTAPVVQRGGVIALMGGAAGVTAGSVILRGLSMWQPFARFPIRMQVTPDAKVYGMALLVSIASGLLFGAVPMRQTLRTSPYEIVKAGSIGFAARRFAIRDLPLVAQLAICAVLVTSSLVAVRGLVRSTHSRFGFEPNHALLVDTDLTMVGYVSDTAPAMQKRMLDALAAIPGVQVGLIDQPPLGPGPTTTTIFTDRTTDFRPATAAAHPVVYSASPGYFQAAGTTVLSGRAIAWHDDASAPRVAVINQEFARRIFGSVPGAVGGYFKRRDGSRIQVVGVVEDGKYAAITEDPGPAVFSPFTQSPSTSSWFVLRSARNPQDVAAAARTTLRRLDASMAVSIATWDHELNNGTAQFGPRMASASLGVLGALGAMLSVTGIFGLAAYSLSKRRREIGIRLALGARKWDVLQTVLGRAIKLLAIGSGAGLVLGILASRVLAVIVYQASPRDPVVLAGVVVAMAVLGLLGTWVPAQRALSVNPLILLRDE
jgi:ABC-type antimicrobial peptide transport system permease subunit